MSRPKGSKNKKSTAKLKSIAKADGFKGGEKEKDFVITSGYKLMLKCLGRVFHSEGETFEDAISKIKISGGAMAVSVLTVEKDGHKTEKILNGRYTNGLFGQGSPTIKAIHLKGVKAYLGV